MAVANVDPPVLSGTARQGWALSVTQGEWTFDDDYITYAYQWRRCDASGASCVDIVGATSPSYTLTAADVGVRIRARVTATEHDFDVLPPAATAPLRWSPPTLSSPTTKNLTNASRSVPNGSGGDLNITCSQVLTGSVGQVQDYNDVVAIGGEFLSTQSADSSGHIVPRRISGVFHLEGWKYDTNLQADFIAARERARIIQIQGCIAHVTDNSTSYHADFFQTQIADIDELRIDRCTIYTDYQGVVLINEYPIASAPAPGNVRKTIISRTVFRWGQEGYGLWIFLCYPPRSGLNPPGPVELYDAWIEDGGTVYPWTNFRLWTGVDGKYGAFRETKMHANGNTYDFLRFSESSDTVPTGTYAGQAAFDCNVGGDGGFWIFSHGGNPPGTIVGLGAPGDAGLGYVSPGYQ